MRQQATALRSFSFDGTGTVETRSALFGREHPTAGETMPHARYFIVRNQDAWVIKYDDEEYGPYKTQSEAMLFAVEAAKNLHKHGGEADVCLMGENGHFRPEWSTGQEART
jgi:hypothetical protein